MGEHKWTEGEKANMQAYWGSNPKPRKNLMKLVRHINMLNPMPTEKSWEYIFYDRILDDDMVNFLLKMKCEGRCPKCGSRAKTILSGTDFVVKEIGVAE